ncbi:MAG: ATP-binding protein, partial [Candidatus Firestonebacteria bacterium]|nr:ATP-binding protein [Candidatus Firestonebacteria bacterium]
LMIVKDQSSFIKYLKSRINNNKIYFFIDEVQRLENPGLFFKGIYDLNLPVKFILSGSSSLEIKAKTQEPLTGRKKIFYLYPFSFEEFLFLKDEKLFKIKDSKDLSPFDKKMIRNYLYEFMVWGGYPEVCLEENIEKKIKTSEEIFNSYLDKDIVNFLRIEDKVVFSKMVKILASQIGNLVNVNEISGTLGIKNETAKKYLNALEATFVIKLVSPFFRNIRKEITKMPKVYFIDNGLCNFSLKRFEDYEKREDQGEVLENYIFSLLIKKLKTFDDLFFWRTKDKAEIDFIVERKNLLPIEVKAVKIKRPIFPRALLGFSKDYQIKKAIIVNLSLSEQIEKNGLDIHYVLPEELDKIIDS